MSAAEPDVHANTMAKHPTWTRSHPFRSEKLAYRALQLPEDDSFIQHFQESALSWHNQDEGLHPPASRQQREWYENTVKDRLLCVVICLTPTETRIQPLPIGLISLNDEAHTTSCRRVHRRAALGLWIQEEYQNKGYGSEAIRWCLRWGFNSAGLHRIYLFTIGYNERAVSLYPKLGFKHEGIMRRHTWFEGDWWDKHCYGMLAEEWKEMQDAVQ